MCQSCHYVHPDPAKDPFYQDRVKNLMYICASLLLLVSFVLQSSYPFSSMLSLTHFCFLNSPT